MHTCSKDSTKAHPTIFSVHVYFGGFSILVYPFQSCQLCFSFVSLLYICNTWICLVFVEEFVNVTVGRLHAMIVRFSPLIDYHVVMHLMLLTNICKRWLIHDYGSFYKVKTNKNKKWENDGVTSKTF